MDAFRSFASDGLTFPAFMIAAGSAMVLHAPYRHRLTREDVTSRHPLLAYLATREWERRGG